MSPFALSDGCRVSPEPITYVSAADVINSPGLAGMFLLSVFYFPVDIASVAMLTDIGLCVICADDLKILTAEVLSFPHSPDNPINSRFRKYSWK